MDNYDDLGEAPTGDCVAFGKDELLTDAINRSPPIPKVTFDDAK